MYICSEDPLPRSELHFQARQALVQSRWTVSTTNVVSAQLEHRPLCVSKISIGSFSALENKTMF